MTYCQSNGAALNPRKVLCHAKYALIASFLLDTDSVFAAAIGAVDGSFWAGMIQHDVGCSVWETVNTCPRCGLAP